jgi:GDP-L-fucose synthase
VAALIRRYAEARQAGVEVVTNWGTGLARREFMYIDDMAAACVFLLDTYDLPGHVNVGTGGDATIRQIAEIVAGTLDYRGETVWDTTKPDGMPQKLLDVSKLTALGWTAQTDLAAGVAATVDWYRANPGSLRR